MTPIELKQARLDAGLTQKKMAEALLISLSRYKAWEGLDKFGPQMESNVNLRVERWLRGKDNGYVVEGWTYTYDNINQLHTFTHDNYAPDVEDADGPHFKYAYKYGDALNDVLDQEEEWRNGR